MKPMNSRRLTDHVPRGEEIPAAYQLSNLRGIEDAAPQWLFVADVRNVSRAVLAKMSADRQLTLQQRTQSLQCGSRKVRAKNGRKQTQRSGKATRSPHQRGRGMRAGWSLIAPHQRILPTSDLTPSDHHLGVGFCRLEYVSVAARQAKARLRSRSTICQVFLACSEHLRERAQSPRRHQAHRG